VREIVINLLIVVKQTSAQLTVNTTSIHPLRCFIPPVNSTAASGCHLSGKYQMKCILRTKKPNIQQYYFGWN